MTFATKMPLVALDKSHMRLVANDKGYWMNKKNQQIQVHPLTPLYTYCHMQLKCHYFVTIEGK